MVPLTALMLPILLSAVVVFVASSIIHMVLKYHQSDYQPLPDEDKLLAALRASGLKRGLYFFPFCTHKDMKSPAVQEKYKQGPVGLLTVFPSGPPVMPKFLGMWFAYCLIIGLFVGYLSDIQWHPARAIWPCFALLAPARSLLTAWDPWSTASGRGCLGAWSSRKLSMG